MKRLKPILALVVLVTASMTTMAQSSTEFGITADGFEKRNKVELFPNPTVDFLNVVIENSDLTTPTIEVFNIIGNAIDVQVQKLETDKYIIDVKSLPAGYYLVTIKDEKGTPIKDMFKFLKR